MGISDLAKRVLGLPAYHTGPAWANMAGWQLARVLTHHGAHAVRRTLTPLSQTEHLIAQGREEGVVIIPNFLSQEDFERLRAYCVTLRSAPSTRYEPNRGKTGLGFTTSPIPEGDSGDAQFALEQVAGDRR